MTIMEVDVWTARELVWVQQCGFWLQLGMQRGPGVPLNVSTGVTGDGQVRGTDEDDGRNWKAGEQGSGRGWLSGATGCAGSC